MISAGQKAKSLDYPELIVGMAGPIGVDLDMITTSLQTALSEVGYTSSPIRLTEIMGRYEVIDPEGAADISKYVGSDTFNTYMRKMSQANALRRQYDDPALLARMAIDEIRSQREEATSHKERVRYGHAYIVRQLKRPEEVSLLRKVYGRQFILTSAYASSQSRREKICDRLRRELSTSSSHTDLAYRADRLIDRDASEDEDTMGQQLRETFHHADVFIDGVHKSEMDAKLKRFIEALFGRNNISPSKDEYGMYAARSASLRSADLSRQVGAAIFSEDGELITQGCNEVPKAFGGTYWDLEEPDHRDITKGFDPNEEHKRELLRDVVERLRNMGFLSSQLLSAGSDSQIVDKLITKRKSPDESGALVGSRLMDVTEYGRVVHAEMLAICDAARLGRSVKGGILYCTTFPCHNCTKHLLASGIRRVVYMEPYPKSRAKDLHPDEIEVEAVAGDKVSFLPFMGISPFRYRDIFQKGKRKDENGRAQDWYRDEKRPMIEDRLAYTENERWALAPLLGELRPVGAS